MSTDTSFFKSIKSSKSAAAPLVPPATDPIPDTFNIHYMYRGSDNTYLHKIGECVLETMSVQYGGDRYRTHGESSSELDVDGLPITGAPPVETTITLNFKELGMVDRKKVKEGV